MLACGLDEASRLELVFERFALGLGALQDSVGLAEHVGEDGIGDVVEAGCGREIRSFGH